MKNFKVKKNLTTEIFLVFQEPSTHFPSSWEYRLLTAHNQFLICEWP